MSQLLRPRHADSKLHLGTGAMILYKVKRVIIAENKTFLGGEEYLKQRGIEVLVVDDAECRALMKTFIDQKPDVW